MAAVNYIPLMYTITKYIFNLFISKPLVRYAIIIYDLYESSSGKENIIKKFNLIA